MKKVYIAGKYNDTSVVRCLNNIRVGIIAAVKVLKRGDIPFCPFLDCLFVLVGGAGDLTEQHFRDYSIEWLKACDEILLLPSWQRSKGCAAELALAQELGLKVTFVDGEAA